MNKKPSHLPPKENKSFSATAIRNRIFAGILFVTPVLATVWIFNFLLNLITSWFPRDLFGLDEIRYDYLLKFLILLLTLLIFYGIGALSLYLGKRATRAVDNFFTNIPVVKTIYKFLKQFRDWIANRSDSMFTSVVLINFPHDKSYAIAFITANTQPAIASHVLDENGQPLECVNVFMPTTPNPTSGFFLIFPKRDVIALDIEVSSAMNLIISAGAVMKELPPEVEAALPHDN
jgi:uncharacterized membrane protein